MAKRRLKSKEKKRSGRSKKKRVKRSARYSIARWLVYFSHMVFARSDGMFINRLISEIGAGGSASSPGRLLSIAIKHKSIISIWPLRARARARRPYILSVCHPRRHTRTHTHTHTHTHARYMYVHERHAFSLTCARAPTRATDRSGIFPLDWNLIKLKICQFRKKHPTAYIDGGHYTRWPTRQNSLA